jgi:small subunit ribosomal protein S17
MQQSDRRKLSGVVVSKSGDKTVAVQVERTLTHPKYLKRYTVNKKFQAHDEQNACQVGDKVTIEESKPYSKSKRFRVIQEA